MARTTTVTVDIECQLDAEYFGEWETLTDEQREVWNGNKMANCQGSGVMSTMCDGCPFCSTFDEDNPQP